MKAVVWTRTCSAASARQRATHTDEPLPSKLHNQTRAHHNHGKRARQSRIHAPVAPCPRRCSVSSASSTQARRTRHDTPGTVRRPTRRQPPESGMASQQLSLSWSARTFWKRRPLPTGPPCALACFPMATLPANGIVVTYAPGPWHTYTWTVTPPDRQPSTPDTDHLHHPSRRKRHALRAPTGTSFAFLSTTSRDIFARLPPKLMLGVVFCGHGGTETRYRYVNTCTQIHKTKNTNSLHRNRAHAVAAGWASTLATYHVRQSAGINGVGGICTRTCTARHAAKGEARVGTTLHTHAHGVTPLADSVSMFRADAPGEVPFASSSRSDFPNQYRSSLFVWKCEEMA